MSDSKAVEDREVESAQMVSAVEMVREHRRVEGALDDPRTRLYRTHVDILLEALDRQAARMPSVEQVRHALTSYGVDPFDGSYGVPQYDALVDDLVALWGAL